MHFLAHDLSPDTYVNIMGQYRPAGSVEEGRCPELCRPPDAREVDRVVEYARAEALWRFDERR
jgi:putative pyruvate formate lyase activating enzyme